VISLCDGERKLEGLKDGRLFRSGTRHTKGKGDHGRLTLKKKWGPKVGADPHLAASLRGVTGHLFQPQVEDRPQLNQRETSYQKHGPSHLKGGEPPRGTNGRYFAIGRYGGEGQWHLRLGRGKVSLSTDEKNWGSSKRKSARSFMSEGAVRANTRKLKVNRRHPKCSFHSRGFRDLLRRGKERNDLNRRTKKDAGV